jgi:hypothetical protein
MPEAMDDSLRVEIAVLEKMGLRWAVLAAWAHDLHGRGVVLEQKLGHPLGGDTRQDRLGCFSTCDVGCDLGHIERVLVAADASSTADSVDYWLGLLGRCMVEEVDTQALLHIKAIHFHYATSNPRRCKCDE